MTTNCFFCNQQLTTNMQGMAGRAAYAYNCDKCGQYILTDPFLTSPPTNMSSDNKRRIAAILYERPNKNKAIIINDNKIQDPSFPSSTIEELLAQFPKRIDEKLNKALQNLGKLSHYLGDEITVDDSYQPILYALNMQESGAILNALRDNKYIAWRAVNAKNGAPIIHITATGWKHIDELSKVNPNSLQGFVAMWFDATLDKAYEEGFKKAIKDAGYKEMRIDMKQHNNTIDDEIIADIKRSKFLVADFTNFRSGVFYEAGFAKGLGLEVIYTCHENYRDKIKEHFDTRQYNHIIWKNEADLYTQLYNRISATIGQGPQAKKES